ncbi:MAG TPA: helix-turn-helix transcriptional regulator [Candidatus Dormibacteraeota bacterium]|jgi:transcriptional regulator with XRE-family HTH domain|nr:helix-turn-helix transcriptional regulator [Candidatus Dormibacteraeota bacterium]
MELGSAGRTTIGDRIAFQRRRRGLSQAKLAGLLGHTEQWLSNIERGERPADRYSTLVRIAEVLRVPVGALTGNGEGEPATEQASANELTDRIRMVLSGHQYLAPGRDTLVDLDDVERRRWQAWKSAREGSCSALADILPGLLCDAEALRGSGPDGLRTVAEVYQLVTALLTVLGQTDVAWVAADRSADAAERAGDTVLAAAASFRLGLAFLAGGQVAQSAHAAGMALAVLGGEARSGRPRALAVWGALQLVLAVASARFGDARSAARALRRAAQAADAMGGEVDGRFQTEFGVANVSVHTVAVAVELGESGEALRQARATDLERLSPERRSRLAMDVARAHLQQRQEAAAIEALLEAERLTPEMVHRHRQPREVVHELLRWHRRPGAELRSLAERLRLES